MDKSDKIELTGKTGLSYLQEAFSTGATSEIGMDNTMCFRGIEATEGKVLFRADPDQRHYNPYGIVHGGYAATLLDTATGAAVMTMLDIGRKCATLSLQISYLGVLSVHSAPLKIEGSLTQLGKKTALAEASVFDCNGKLCAHGTANFMII